MTAPQARRRLLCALAALALSAGCRRKGAAPAPDASAEAGAPTATPATVLEALKEAELALAMAPSGTEFPEWEMEIPDWGGANPFAGCGRVGGDRNRGPAETASAASPQFYPARQEHPGTSLQARVVLYPGAAQAKTALASASRALECRAKAVGEGKANTVGHIRYVEVVLEALGAPAVGDERYAARLSGRARGMDEVEEAELYWDVLAVRRGRTLLVVEAHGLGAPLEAPVVERFVAQALAKIDAANP
jgi:hypothetical protein